MEDKELWRLDQYGTIYKWNPQQQAYVFWGKGNIVTLRTLLKHDEDYFTREDDYAM